MPLFTIGIFIMFLRSIFLSFYLPLTKWKKWHLCFLILFFQFTTFGKFKTFCQQVFNSIIHHIAFSRQSVNLLFANRKDIRLYKDGALRNATILANQLEEAAAVDFYYAENMIFWTDIGLEMIKGIFNFLFNLNSD